MPIYCLIIALTGRSRSAIDLMQAVEKGLAGTTFARPWPLVWVVRSKWRPSTWEATLRAYLSRTESLLVVRFVPRHVRGQGPELVKLQAWLDRQVEGDKRRRWWSS
jgi:hypothetical protein